MFVEKLTEKELNDFVKNIFPMAKKIEVKKHGDLITAQAFGNEVTYTIVLSDFNSKVVRGTQLENYGLQKHWIDFNLEKFGNEYKQAYNKNLYKKYEQEMLK